MSSRFEHLLAPGRIGALTLRNRIVMAPMGTNQERADGFLGEPILGYYEQRARGGAGLIIAGVAAVAWPDGACNPGQAAISDDRFLPDWRAFAERCKRHGAAAAVQLQHAGKVAQQDVASGRALWVPSTPRPKGGLNDLFDELTAEERTKATAAFTQPTSRQHYHEMSGDDIALLIEHFAAAAERAQRAGLDGVELHAGHGYLLQSFLSPASNFRDDEYGGSLENRARLLLETIRAVRARCGAELALWCRIDAREFRMAGGIGESDARRTAALVEQAGADAVHISAYADPTSGAGFTEAPLLHEPGGYLPFAAGVRQRVSIPVIAVGRIEPERADAAIRDGQADFIAMGRKLLADPDLPNYLAAGQPERVRPCVYSYQCVSKVFLREAARCTVNPQMGRELDFEGEREVAPVARTALRRNIAVVGGGPAGLEFARRAAQRGHRVTLFERSDALGGRLRLAAQLDPELARFVHWLVDEATRAGVKIHLSSEATAESLLQSAADCFVLALGAQRTRGATHPAQPVDRPERLPGALSRPVPPFDRAEPLPESLPDNVLDAEHAAPLLDAPAGQRVAVLGSDVIGVKLCEALAAAGGLKVTLFEQQDFAPEMALPRRWRAADALRRLNVERVVVKCASPTKCVTVEPGAVVLGADAGAAERRFEVEHIVWARGLVAQPELADALRARGVSAQQIHEIGDGADVRYLTAAIHEAAELGARL